jgi:hypothetical protein
VLTKVRRLQQRVELLEKKLLEGAPPGTVVPDKKESMPKKRRRRKHGSKPR